MRLALALLLTTGCAYVTQSEYDAHWDVDGDGWPIGDDCDDNDPAVFPWAPDHRGDGCDADCGREPDDDGDDWPNTADCDPDDKDVHPCSEAEVEGDGFDHDCDGLDGIRTDVCAGIDPDFNDTEPISCGGKS